MLDNGLLKYFKNKSKKGLLTLDKVPGLVASSERAGRAWVYYKENEKYFCRYCFGLKQAVDAEVLISQLYPKLGIPSAIYLPASKTARWEKSVQTVISDNVEAPNRVQANDFGVKQLLKHLRTGPNGIYKPKPFEHFTPGCVKQIATMQALDLATCNMDRNSSNFFVNLNNDGKIDGITTIDHEFSAGVIYEDCRKRSGYEGFFGRYNANREGIVEDIKNNQTVLSVVSPHELAQTIGSGIDLIPKTAEDIKETIGYDIEQRYVEALQRSFEQTAEELCQ